MSNDRRVGGARLAEYFAMEACVVEAAPSLVRGAQSRYP